MVMDPFFIDGPDDNIIHIQLYLREFELRGGRVLLDLNGKISPTGRTFTYFEDSGRETRLDLDTLPPLEGAPSKLQLFTVQDGQTLLNSELLKSLFLEARIKGEAENTGENSFKIVICEHRKISNDPLARNRWQVFSELDQAGPHIIGEVPPG